MLWCPPWRGRELARWIIHLHAALSCTRGPSGGRNAMTQAVHSAEGEDRSSYQKVGPWTSDAFGLVKATEATNWADPTFAENWANLRGERKPRGAYPFFHPEMNAAEQAEFFMSVLHKNGLEPGDMLVIDSEI